VSDVRSRGPLAGQAPIGWTALSAVAGDRGNANRLYTAHDSVLQQSRLYVIDVSDRPARITDGIVLLRGGALAFQREWTDTGETQFIRLGSRAQLGF
jgi:hypothetical protein